MPAPRQWKVARLDIAAFAREASTLDGQSRLDSLPRLFTSQPEESRDNGDALVSWRLSGRVAGLPGAGRRLSTLSIRAEAQVVMQCQRCLKPLPLDLAVERTLFFMEGENAAALLDADSDEDVLALEPTTDANALVEDELLLALPIVPRHEVCPEPLLAGDGMVGEAAAEKHPFASLAALKPGLTKKPH